MPIDLRTYTPEWQAFRKERLRQAGHRCESCGVADRSVRESAQGDLYMVYLSIAHCQQYETWKAEAETMVLGEGSCWQALSLTGLRLGLGALKVREDGGGLILRAYEPAGARGESALSLPEGWEGQAETDLLEREVGPAELRFSPFQVHSWALHRAG